MYQTADLQQFAQLHAIQGVSDQTLQHLYDGDFSLSKADDYRHFYQRIHNEIFSHPVIRHNPYTAWFANAELSAAEVRHFVVQFSVFSNQFLLAQLGKVINAPTIELMRASKEILANEIGVAFNAHQNNTDVSNQLIDMGATEGSVEGGSFHFAAAHFEILIGMAQKIGLSFDDMGRREHGTPSTLFFCDELIRLYGSASYPTSEAASFAVEHWAAAGFWKQLIHGLKNYKATSGLQLPLTFFTWHDRIEDNHARHTKEELEHYYFCNDINEDAFINDASEMLDGVYAFWQGLDADRRSIH